MVKQEFDLFELIKIIILNKWLIIIFVLIVSIAAVIYSLVTPQIWRSEASFYAVGSSNSNLLSNMSGISGIAGGLLGMEADVDVLNFITVMQSRTFSESVIKRFDLIRYFKLKEKDPMMNMDDALRKLKKITSIGLSEKTSLVIVAAETKDKNLSRDMVNFYIAGLDNYNRIQKITKGKRNREFLAKRVEELKANIDSLLIVNRDFQLKNKAVSVDDQSQALISAYSNVIAEKMKIDIALELALNNYSTDSPQVRQLNTQRDAILKQIKSLESDKSGLKPQYLIDLSDIPDLAVKMAQIKINLEIAQKVMEYIYPQYEAAKLEELRDMPSLEVIDYPREAGRRVRPRRAIICIVAALIATCLGIFGAIIKEIVFQDSERSTMIKELLFKKR